MTILKKTILYFVLICISNYLITHYFFINDDRRFITIGAMILGIYSCICFSTKLAGLFTKKDLPLGYMMPNYGSKDRLIIKTINLNQLVLTILIIIHICGYIYFYKLQQDLLNKNGIYVESVIVDKKWESQGKSHYGYNCYYTYKYGGVTISKSFENDSIEIGDTIGIKFLPDNPYNNIIMKIKK